MNNKSETYSIKCNHVVLKIINTRNYQTMKKRILNDTEFILHSA